MIAIEGIDAAGKRTQTSLLCSWLRSQGLTVSSKSFPDYSTRIGGEIKAFFGGERDYPPEVRHLLLACNRWENKSVVEGMVNASDVAVMNRYSGSNLAYGVANGLRLEWLKTLEEGLPVADLVIVLDADPSTASSRRRVRKDLYEQDLALQRDVRKVYLDLASKLSWTVVDANRSIEATHDGVVGAVRSSAVLAEPGSGTHA